MKLAAGLYEALVTRDHARALRELEALVAEKEALGEDGAPKLLARHLRDQVVKALANLPADGRLGQQLESRISSSSCWRPRVRGRGPRVKPTG